MTEWIPRRDRIWNKIRIEENWLREEVTRPPPPPPPPPEWAGRGIPPWLQTQIGQYQRLGAGADLGKAFGVPIAGQMLLAKEQGRPIQEIISAPLTMGGMARTRPPTKEERARGIFAYQPIRTAEEAYEEWQPPGITLPGTKNPILNILSGLILAQPTETGETRLDIKSAIELIPYLLLPLGKGTRATALTNLNKQVLRIEAKLARNETISLAEKNTLKQATTIESQLSKAIKGGKLPSDVTNLINKETMRISRVSEAGGLPKPKKVTPVTGEVTTKYNKAITMLNEGSTIDEVVKANVLTVSEAEKLLPSYQRIRANRLILKLDTEEAIRKAIIEDITPTIPKAEITPPIKPPAVPPVKGLPEPEAIKNFWKAASNKESALHWQTTETLRTAERAKRATVFQPRLIELLEKGVEPEEAFNIVKKEVLTGKLPTTATTLGDLITPEIRSGMIAKIENTLADNPYEITATITALKNALAGKPIPRKLGIKGGSAYTRLEKVFGDTPEFMKAIEKPDEFLGKIKGYREFTPAELAEFQAKGEYLGGVPTRPFATPTLLGEEALQTPIQRQKFVNELPSTIKSVLDTRSAEEQFIAMAKRKFVLGEYLEKFPEGLKFSESQKLVLSKLFKPVGGKSFADLPSETIIKQLDMIPKPLRMAMVNRLQRVGIGLLDVLNLPRALQTAYDASVMFRQLIVAGAAYPMGWAKQWKPLFQAFRSPELAKAYEAELLKNPDVLQAIKGMGGKKLEWSEWGVGAKRFMKEEPFISAIPSKIWGIRASERAFTVPSNGMRASLIAKHFPIMRKLGLPEEAFGELIEFANLVTGRAPLPKSWQGYAPLLSAILYSPRLLIARVTTPKLLFASSPYVRKLAWQTLARFLALGATVLGIYKAMGGEIEYDPRSSNFGKLIIGNTQLDIWGGYVQYVRFAAQLITGQRKTRTGQIQELNRKEVIDRFFQSKWSPGLGLLADIAAGETYIGEELKPDVETVREQAISRLAPLFAQDVYDAVRYNEGLIPGLAALTGGLGIGVISYKGKGGLPESDIMKKLQEKYGEPSQPIPADIRQKLEFQQPITEEDKLKNLMQKYGNK